MNKQQQTPVAKQNDDASMWAAMGLVWELGYLIAVPAVAFGFGGAYLDEHLETSPAFLLGGFALAFTLSIVVIYRRIKHFLK